MLRIAARRVELLSGSCHPLLLDSENESIKFFVKFSDSKKKKISLQPNSDGFNRILDEQKNFCENDNMKTEFQHPIAQDKKKMLLTFSTR